MQTAKCADTVVFFLIASVQVAFSFDFLLAYSVRLVPMQFRQPDASTLQPDSRDTLHLSPSALAIVPAQAFDIANSATPRQ
jgi:hypothetical protein